MCIFSQLEHGKTYRMTWAHISLCIRPETSQYGFWAVKDPNFLQADSKDSDQTRIMIWVFSGFVVLRLKYTLGLVVNCLKSFTRSKYIGHETDIQYIRLCCRWCRWGRPTKPSYMPVVFFYLPWEVCISVAQLRYWHWYFTIHQSESLLNNVRYVWLHNAVEV